MSGKYDDLPTWAELVELTGWVGQGCPCGHRDYDGRVLVKKLYELLQHLPRHLPHYAYGTDEWRAELKRLKDKEHEEGCDNPDCQRCVPERRQ